MKTVIWFRKDLRIFDNPALTAGIEKGADTALFFVTPKQWQQHDMAPIQADFIIRHLKLLKVQLAAYDIELKVVQVDDFNAQVEYIVSHHKNDSLLANIELLLNEKLRDQQIINRGLNLTLFADDCIVPAGSVLNGQGQMFKVFSPFKRAWLKHVLHQGLQVTSVPEGKVLPTTDENELFDEFEIQRRDSSRWPLADQVLQDVLPNFFQFKLRGYHENRDFPGIKGTSGLSPYFAIGTLSARAIASQLIQSKPELLENPNYPEFAWLNELIWRDFYLHLIYHYPNLCKHQNFNDKYDKLAWPNNDKWFKAWCEGKTGYPIVDAAMKQLLDTGWMHNRLRMIVASFLTKHLRCDWRLGEKFFMQHLIDGEFAANNGGWQWSASTGCDAQPYFRVFNPILQSQKFDPQGTFIRKYCQELKQVPDKHIHFPHEYLAKQGRQKDYCPAIVEHKSARLAALEFYKQA
ncbi:deoxyribodipyrimidine photo-lyase [Catenovulum sp. SM1970]|uniref:deoxyribodipyrimidine photo-lyase n=1 Tax=Marinifaba aquimaris TaxID=2741323 RepID=UPI001573557B|nr:deoxyribodipyrimidine photo-lyase [Marinifaba aquimaris]NTS76473.1 deoxyribodipyrimidine photo-lyase [Marinifaba aquimaris]